MLCFHGIPLQGKARMWNSISNRVEIRAVECQHGFNGPWRVWGLLFLMNRSLQLGIILSNFYFGSLHYEFLLYYHILEVKCNFRHLLPESTNSSSYLHCLLYLLLGEKKPPQKFLSFLSNIFKNQQEFHQLHLFLFLSFYLMLIFRFAPETPVQEDF